MNREQRNRAERLHQLHVGPAPLVLPNVWDVASARIVEQAGAKVIATTSAGMAWALGYADGEQMPAQELLSACRRICRAVNAPVTVDIERGFGASAQDTAVLVNALIEMGVVGINIEDGTDPLTQALADAAVLRERIACIREVARQQGLPLFINARIDTYCAAGVPAQTRLEETLRRALSYIDAGADGIFVPGLADPDEIRHLVSRLSVPLNIYAGYPGAPAVADLQMLGVRRVSLGCGAIQAVLAHLANITTEALVEGRYDTMASHMLSTGQINGLFAQASAEEASDVRLAAAGRT
jgi:2-methylisocitrate lyase-like PEP mutase family enzyme